MTLNTSATGEILGGQVSNPVDVQNLEIQNDWNNQGNSFFF